MDGWGGGLPRGGVPCIDQAILIVHSLVSLFVIDPFFEFPCREYTILDGSRHAPLVRLLISRPCPKLLISRLH